MTPFRRVRVAAWGTYETPHGAVRLMRADAAAIVRATEPHVAIELEFRAGHQTDLRGYFDATAGVAAIAAAKDGLYATDIEWKPEADELLRGELYRFLVPAFLLTPARRVKRVISLALTNTAVDGLAPLAELLGAAP